MEPSSSTPSLLQVRLLALVASWLPASFGLRRTRNRRTSRRQTENMTLRHAGVTATQTWSRTTVRRLVASPRRPSALIQLSTLTLALEGYPQYKRSDKKSIACALQNVANAVLPSESEYNKHKYRMQLQIPASSSSPAKETVLKCLKKMLTLQCCCEMPFAVYAGTSDTNTSEDANKLIIWASENCRLKEMFI